MVFSSVQFSHSVMSDSLGPHELQHARPPCPSPNPRVYSNSCLSSWWWHPTMSSSVIPFSSCLQSLSIRVFSNESALHMRWLKYWSFSFSISPSNKHLGLISFGMDSLDLLAVQGARFVIWNYLYRIKEIGIEGVLPYLIDQFQLKCQLYAKHWITHWEFRKEPSPVTVLMSLKVW